VVYELENHFPKDVEQIEALPGIGKYTAGAIASFAFDSPVPAVDANIARVLARLFDFQERIDTSVGQKQIWEWAADLVPSSGGRIWNSALMELGQTLCGPRKTFCNECPIAESCRCVEPLGLPIKKLKQGVTNIDEHVILNIRNGKVLLEQETGNRRKGMWKLPSRDKKEVTKLDLITTQNYGITRYKVKMHIYKSKNAQLNENEKWVSLDELASLPVPSPYRRALELITKV
jgi:A/G-specific adenine glycosylase